MFFVIFFLLILFLGWCLVLPDWNTHVKWAVRFGVRREVAEFINRLIDAPEEVLRDDQTELGVLYRSDPESVKAVLIGHDWGRRGKARLDLLKTYCHLRFGEEGVIAAELHHVLDYIAYVRDPENLAKMIISSQIFHTTAGKPYAERIESIRKQYSESKTKDGVKKLADVLAKLDYKVYREIIVDLLEVKAREWELHREVLDFVISNLDELLASIDAYLLKRKRRIARSPLNATLELWLEERKNH